MPIIPNFLSGGGVSGGVKLLPATGIIAQPASERVYIKWTDPNDIVISGTTFAEWGGTIFVRKAGSMPSNRRDGAIILDSKTRNAYKDEWFCDSGLSNGTTYYYKLFPYTTEGIYTDDAADEFTATPAALAPGNVSNISLTAAGNGKLGISWTDPALAIVSNGVTVSTWASTKVVVKTGSYATNPNDSSAAFTFSSTTRNAYASTQLVATGLTNGTTYYVSFFPISEDGAVNTNTVNRGNGVANRMTIDVVPSQSGTLTYRGENQIPSWNNYDTAKMTISCTPQTNAGTYEASVTPNTDYRWSDGTTSARTIQWTIGKAALPKPTLSNTSITLNASNAEDTFTVTRDGDGAVSAVSSNTNIVTVTATGNTTSGGKIFRVSSVNNTNGIATVTIHVSEGTNYLAYTADDVTCSVSAEFIPTVLNDATWAQISEVSLAGTASSYWEIGDRKSVALSGNINTLSISGVFYVFIIGFDHNASIESGGAHSIHFGTFMNAKTNGKGICLADSSYMSDDEQSATTFDRGNATFSMNHFGGAYPNAGGWKSCDMRYDILGSTNVQPYFYPSQKNDSFNGYDPSDYDLANNPVTMTFMSVLPRDLRSVMRPITKYTNNFGNGFTGSSYVTATVDYLPLMSEYELFGTTTHADSYEQVRQMQYEYYETNSAGKYRHSNTTGNCYYWLRSPSRELPDNFVSCATSSSGTTSVLSIPPTTSVGLAPIFMV